MFKVAPTKIPTSLRFSG